MELTSDAVPHDAEAHYCGLPDIYRGEDVPLSNIHHITWDDIDGKTPFRENKELQKQLLKLMKKYPYMAHNAAFEDSWFKIHLDGYAEARRAGKIIVIDSRLDLAAAWTPTCARSPRESAPAATRELGAPPWNPSPPTPTSSTWASDDTDLYAPHRPSRVQPQEPIREITDPSAGAPARHSAIRLGTPARSKLGRSLMAAP